MKTKFNVKKLVGIAVFTAIVVVLQLLGGGIKVGGLFSISLVLVPIVVGAAVYGWEAGLWLGGAFGLAVLLSGDAAAFMAVDPIGTVVTVMLKGIGCGFAAGLLYKLLSGKSMVLGALAAALVCPVVNTGIFLIGCRLFFYDTVAQWGAAAGFPNAAAYMFLGLAGINFLVEVATNLILAPVIIRLIRIGKKG